MSYKLNQTDGTLLVDLVDGSVDSTTTDITLVGRNYTGYGEAFNENFIKMMENFAATSAPANPLRGQIWYDTSAGRLKVWDGTQFRGTDTTTYAALKPEMVAGDLWIDATNKQLYFSDGTTEFLAGPSYTRTQGQTEYDAITLVDIYGVDKIVGRWSVGNSTVALVSKEAFTPAVIDVNAVLLTGFPTPYAIKQGVNIVPTYSDFYWNGSATNADNLISGGISYSAASFLQVSPALPIATYQTTNQHLHINNDRGFLTGDVSRFSIATDTTSVDRDIVLTALRDDANIDIQTSSSGAQSSSFKIETSNQHVGIFNSAPQAALHVGTTASNGDVIIEGNLTVKGSNTALEVVNLRVQDKQIELGINDDSSLLTDAQANEGGIILKSSGLDKELIWKNSTNSWTSSVNIDVADGLGYKINGANVLTINELHSSVTTASGLTSVGTLSILDVDNINLNGSTIACTNDMSLNINGDITMSGTTKIRNLATPGTDNDAAHKKYVDDIYKEHDIELSVDSTGLTDIQLALLVNDLCPSTTKNNGVNARVHCTSYAGAYTYNATDGVSKSFTAVDSAGVQNQSVVTDFSFTDVSDTVTLTVTRTLKRFAVVAGAWVWQEDLTSSV